MKYHIVAKKHTLLSAARGYNRMMGFEGILKRFLVCSVIVVIAACTGNIDIAANPIQQPTEISGGGVRIGNPPLGGGDAQFTINAMPLITDPRRTGEVVVLPSSIEFCAVSYSIDQPNGERQELWAMGDGAGPANVIATSNSDQAKDTSSLRADTQSAQSLRSPEGGNASGGQGAGARYQNEVLAIDDEGLLPKDVGGGSGGGFFGLVRTLLAPPMNRVTFGPDGFSNLIMAVSPLCGDPTKGPLHSVLITYPPGSTHSGSFKSSLRLELNAAFGADSITSLARLEHDSSLTATINVTILTWYLRDIANAVAQGGNTWSQSLRVTQPFGSAAIELNP
jgi:hypothetical protein